MTLHTRCDLWADVEHLWISKIATQFLLKGSKGRKEVELDKKEIEEWCKCVMGDSKTMEWITIAP